MSSIALLIPYFGKFPEWSDLYFETLKRNSTVDFIFYTDCEIEKYAAPNIKYKKISFKNYINWVNTKLDVSFKPASPYKLCDLRPWYGTIHIKDFEGYDFYGWTDMDLFFGNIREFYTEDILKRFDVISAHEVRISGHLAIFRNNKYNRYKWRKIYDWRRKLSHPEFVGIDEHGITNAYTMTVFDKFNEKFGTNINNIFTKALKVWKKRKLYLKEQYTTPFTHIPWLDNTINSQHPDVWYYKDGTVTNSRDIGRSFIYIHFMNFKNSRYRHDNTAAPWEGRDKVCYASKGDLKHGIQIDPIGIYAIEL